VQPSTPPPASPSELPLCLPAQDLTATEELHTAALQALRQALLPLRDYCQRTEARLQRDLAKPLTSGDKWAFAHSQQLREMLTAVALAMQLTDTLLRGHHANTYGLNRQLLLAYHRPASLELLLRENALQVDWQAIALRLFARFPYEPTPSTLVDRIRSGAAFQAATARLLLPLPQRQAAGRITSHDLTQPDQAA
jgi:hypothetical protein